MSLDTVGSLTADALVLLGVSVMTLGVFGIFRMRDIYTQLHAASKSVFLGVISIVFSSFASQDPAIIWRVLLIGVLLLVTTPVAAHAIARAAFLEGERMQTVGAVDESGRRLDASDEADGASPLLDG